MKQLDYYHQKGKVQVALRVAEGLRSSILGNWEISKKMTEMLGFDGDYTVNQPKDRF